MKCRDCSRETETDFHIVGLKCTNCGSYNTVRCGNGEIPEDQGGAGDGGNGEQEEEEGEEEEEEEEEHESTDEESGAERQVL